MATMETQKSIKGYNRSTSRNIPAKKIGISETKQQCQKDLQKSS